MRQLGFLGGLASAVFAVGLAACGGQGYPGGAYGGAVDPLDDEAMRRAKREGKLPSDAAREWFYPKEIHNYFQGMDEIALLATGVGEGGGVDLLQTPVYQLLDKPAVPQVRKVDPIQTPSEILGRNTWMIWAGGNEGFWDWLGLHFGFVDLIRVLDSRTRPTRFADAGLINEPGMMAATAPDDLGLWLDVPVDPEIREWRRRYIRRAFNLDSAPGMAVSVGYAATTGATMPGAMAEYPGNTAYDPRIPPPEIYGLSSGVVGLRLFPNPNFDARARRRWNGEAYYADPVGDPNLIRPYRVGMSCAFCHASYHPLNPPRDLVNPEWRNISGNIGAQYLRIRAVFGNLLPKNNLVYHILDSQPPGTIDTSLIASDNINNPNTMNAVFNLMQRALVSFRNPREQQSAPSAGFPAIWYNPTGQPDGGPDRPTDDQVRIATHYWNAMVEVGRGPPDTAKTPPVPGKTPAETGMGPSLGDELRLSNDAVRRTPRVLLDGADSIGAWGALARVYLNIGTNWEQWNTLHESVVGFLPQKPFTIANTKRHSVYWLATDLRVAPLRDYFLKVTSPMPLAAADGGATAADGKEAAAAMGAERRRLIDVSLLARGRKVFAGNCIVCHSSIQPERRHAQMAIDAGVVAGRPAGRPLELWDHDPGRWLSDPDYLRWAEEAVEKPDFWRANYLSTDYRVPVSLVGTNACRAMATNAITGNMWEDFASVSYRTMPSVGAIPFFNPYLGPGGGPDLFTPRHKVRGAGIPEGGGGPGFYRVPTLVSIWATAPYLHNNSLGLFNNDPSIAGRLAAFDDGIRKLLWPERRLESSSYNGATPERLKADHGLIWRTPEETYLAIGGVYLPELLGSRLGFLRNLGNRYPRLREIGAWRWVPTAVLFVLAFFVLWLADRRWIRFLGYATILIALAAGVVIYYFNGGLGGIRIGPFPKGTPVSLLASANPDADPKDLLRVLATTRDAITEIQSTRPDQRGVDEIMRTRIAPALMSVNRCPDFVMDRGHYFKWFDSMSDADKEALIELLKTF